MNARGFATGRHGRAVAWRYRAVVALAMLVMALRIGSTWTAFNDVIDEPYHIGAGIAMYEAGRHVYGIQHPPLPRLVGALALADARATRDAPEGWPRVDDLHAFEIGHRALLNGPRDYWDTLVRAR